MPEKSRQDLKSYFETGDTPTSADFDSLIDSFIHQSEDEVHFDQQTGFVGIGTKQPQQKLQVGGSLSVDDAIAIGTESPNEKLTIDGSISLKELDAAPKVTPDFGKLYVKEDKLVSAEFDGESSNISMPSLGVTKVGDFTICLWFKVLQAAHSRHYLLDFRGDGSELAQGCGLLIDEAGNGTATLGHYSKWGPNDRSIFQENVGRVFGDWHHTVLLRRDNILEAFFDGKMVSNQPTLGGPVKDSPISWNNNWRMGAFSANVDPGGNYWMKGSMDELAIWTRALSPEEVRNIFLGGRGLNLKENYSDRLLSYWRMIVSDQLSDSKIQDQIDPGREGVLHNTDFHQDIIKALHFIDGNGNDQILGGAGVVGAGTSAASVWSQKESDIFYDDGDVGIGVSNPLHSLHVVRAHEDSQNIAVFEGKKNPNNGLLVSIENETLHRSILELRSGSAPTTKLWVGGDGNFVRKIKFNTGLGPYDTTKNGQIVTRVLQFVKHYNETAIRIIYSDNFRVQGPAGCSARWEIKINGESAPGGALLLDKYSAAGRSNNQHDPATILGYAKGLGAGSHEIQVWVSTPVPNHGVGNPYTGWYNCTWTIEAQEVFIEE